MGLVMPSKGHKVMEGICSNALKLMGYDVKYGFVAYVKRPGWEDLPVKRVVVDLLGVLEDSIPSKVVVECGRCKGWKMVGLSRSHFMVILWPSPCVAPTMVWPENSSLVLSKFQDLLKVFTGYVMSAVTDEIKELYQWGG